MAVTQTN